ncbi:hypothetical protein PoB_002797500 [Plakobranchus ocellatus]|uniref:RNase H type-1 domain-containing protein n=1 Tax=Plakobranchus ocellatus TaxID=259542 RepID=A0AAV4A3M8_9GAST|nr:hypothetical protein PoB_002797500 [Plakobranchus ocellatus]
MTLEEMSQVANRKIKQQYPQTQWVRIYTDGSATNAIENRGSGEHIEMPNGTTETDSFLIGTHCSTNYKAEATALERTASLVKITPDIATSQIVFLQTQSLLSKHYKTEKGNSFTPLELLLDIAKLSPRTVL